jgi:DNA-binding transcriptional ArsR family regulator
MVYLLAAPRTADRLSTTFAALADPTRRSLLKRLSTGEATVTELAQPFAMSLPAVSKHLKVLEKAGLISRGKEAQWRPCRLDAKPLQEVSAWTQQYRRHWEARLERLDDYLQEYQKELRKAEKRDNQKRETKHGRDK